MIKKQLSVRLHGRPVGVLEQLASGKLIFTYEKSETQSISISMPIREEPYHHEQCEAFFGGLLPERDATKKTLGKIFGISPSNSFALLKAIGEDCAGAISFYEMDAPVSQKRVDIEGRVVTEDELYEHIKALPNKPLFQGFDDLRLSLAGVQDKAAVCVIDGKIALPTHGCPTTHILKPAMPGFEGIVENEFLCMQTASQVGLSVPAVEIRQAKEITYLLVERYDRRIQQNKIERIHQEDFCQALGILSTRKYQNEGGPGFKECFALLNNTTQPAVNRIMMMSAMVFNFLIGNMDAHGKNFSLLHQDGSQIGMSPLYDIVCTRVYPHLTSKMAMKIGSQYDADKVLPRHWEQFCETINYSYPALKNLIKKQGEAIVSALESNSEFYNTMTGRSEIIKKVSEAISKNVIRVLRMFDK